MTSGSALTVASYRDATGEAHDVVVRAIDGGWEVVDEHEDGGKLVERLTDPADDRACAEAIARDYAEQAVEPEWAQVA